MSVEANEALFGVIGDRFGGNGETSFALPDLRCNLVVGE
jgi:microcystin-dependent protein